ncbi:hypothetical protein LWC35_22255 [Pseudonocardia kujensis]|uniref:hypothetical protein n=1 Tax=Pseudonocardia kujensis TaxID=1128675 RepID=UPI001E58A074|nr:hypothetical protein [Pseudonocardia kujensis]MCE0765606.1 hypothetical protein [Pseudonocardia kujensis]
MERTYTGTAVAFEGLTLPEIRDPVATGPGPGSMRAAEQALAEVSRKLEDVNAELGALEREYADAHEGEAAEATRMYLRKLGEPGRVGTVMFRLAARALGDQAEYYTVANRELTALRTTETYLGRTGPYQLDERQQSAAHVANRYQENSNANLASAFQAFTPLTLPTPDTTAVAPATAPGWPRDGDVAVPTAPTATAAAPPGGGAATPVPLAPPAPVPGDPAGTVAPAGVAPAVPPAPTPAVGGVRGGPPALRPPSAPDPGNLAPTPVAGLNRRAGLPVTAPPPPSGDRAPTRRTPVDLPPGVLSPSAPRTAAPRAPERIGPERIGPGRPGTGTPFAGPGESGRTPVPRAGEPVTRPTPGERLRTADPLGEPARTGQAARTSPSHLPYVPAGAGAGGRGEPHPRPDWLVEDDPDGVWLADVPTYGPGVLRGEDGGGDGRTGSGM